MIGSLMYLTASRSDIQFSTCLCARYQENCFNLKDIQTLTMLDAKWTEKAPQGSYSQMAFELHFNPLQYQLADIFTKPLDEPTFKRLIVELGDRKFDTDYLGWVFVAVGYRGAKRKVFSTVAAGGRRQVRFITTCSSSIDTSKDIMKAQTHPNYALHPIDVENYDASHSDDEDEAEKDVAASYRIE
ncbi:hypothetical protein Tco_0478224 [Tanacetum coccineum]